MRIFDNKDNNPLFSEAKIASTFFKRLIGLIGKKNIDSESALVFYKTNFIHTYFMRFNIDIIFLDKNMRVVKVYNNLKPWRFAGCFNAENAIECVGGVANKKEIGIGAQVRLN